MASSARDVLINVSVDNLDGYLALLTAKHIPILARDDPDPHGHFAWILDPDSTKIEPYQPKPR